MNTKVKKQDDKNNKAMFIISIILIIVLTASCITNVVLVISIEQMHAYTMQFIQDTFYYATDTTNQMYGSDAPLIDENRNSVTSENVPLVPDE